MNKKQSKAWYKRWWVWLILIFALIGIGNILGSHTNNGDTTTNLQAPKSEQPSLPKEEKWDIEVIYPQIKDGMEKSDTEKILGKKSDNCSESSSEYIGKIEVCSYGNLGDNGSITVTYQNNKVSSKAKTKF